MLEINTDVTDCRNQHSKTKISGNGQFGKIYSETSIHFRRGSEKESGKRTDAGAIVEIGFAQGP
jgi:hypothetical protein